MQEAKFFMENLRVTQTANNPYSHAGSLAVDFGGLDGGSDNIVAPCDIIIKRVRLNATGEVYFESVDKVLFADGTSDYLHGIFIHGDNRHLKVGQVIPQGAQFLKEGGWGSGKPNKFANHIHVEMGKGKFKGSLIQFKNAQGTYVIENQSKLEDLLLVGADVKIIDTKGMNFKIEVKEEIPNNNEDLHNKIEHLETENAQLKDVIKLLENSIEAYKTKLRNINKESEI